MRGAKLSPLIQAVCLLAIVVSPGCSDPDPDSPSLRSWKVLATAGEGGQIDPASATVADGKALTLTVQANDGYLIDTVEGCDGTLEGNAYTTAPIHADCSVGATFTKQTFAMRGSVHGLEGVGLLLRNQEGFERAPSSDGTFEFPKRVAYGEPWEISVAWQPVSPSQTCTVNQSSGIITVDVDVRVDCVTNRYPIEVEVTGLQGDGLLLLNNGGDELAISEDGIHAFPSMADLSFYLLDVAAQPSSPRQTCSLSNSFGIIYGQGVVASLHCVTERYPVAVTVSGLSSGKVVLRNLGGDDLQVDANGTYQFPTKIADESAYSVTVATQPSIPERSCRVHGAKGQLQGKPAWVWVACTNYALQFDGESGHVTLADDLSMPALGAPYTVEAWVRPFAIGVLGIAAWGNYGTANEALAFRLNSDSVQISWWGTTLDYTGVDLTDGWHHVATSWDGAARRLFLDGVEVASDTPEIPHAVPDGRNFRIGLGYNGQYFHGELDDVRVWSTALTAATIDAWRITEVLDNHPHKSALVGAWAFREGVGTTVTDTTHLSPLLQGEFSGGVSWVTVDPSITIIPSALRIAPNGNTATLTAAARDEYRAPATVHTWQSSDATIVSVASTGPREAKVTTGAGSTNVGLVRISATLESGASARALVYARSSGTRVIYVDPSQAAPPEGGRFWYEAFGSLSDALAVSTPGDEIWVAQGTYMPSELANRTASFELKNGVTIYGGFQGTENARNNRKPDTFITTLTGHLSDGVSQSFHVVKAVDVDDSAVLDGFTITGGKADGAGKFGQGGGIFVANSEAQFSRLQIVDNIASAGGGMYATGAISLTDTVFKQNTAVNSGGGLYVAIADGQTEPATLTDVIFDQNTSTTGGGMTNLGGSVVELTGVEFVDNTASGSGGGLYNIDTNSNPVLTDVLFEGNTAGGSGGGMASLIRTAPVLNLVTFRGNNSSDAGGGMSALGNAVITNSIFDGNTATGNGGGISINEGDVKMFNVLVVNNKAHRGGGIRIVRASPTFTNVTVALNFASLDGGIAPSLNVVKNILTFQNSILWGNSSPAPGRANIGEQASSNIGNNELRFINSILEDGCYVGGTISLFYPDIVHCTNISDDNPQFVDADGGNFQLQAGSPALDAGDNALIAGVNEDLEGNPRIVGANVDLGPYERQ